MATTLIINPQEETSEIVTEQRIEIQVFRIDAIVR